MRDSIILFAIGLALGSAIFASLFCLTRCVAEPVPEVERDTVVVVDTVTITKAEPVEVREVGTVRARLLLLSKVDSCQHLGDSCQHSDVSCQHIDSAEVLIPIEQKVYTDSANYRAVVSGYNVALDTLEVFNRREITTYRHGVTTRPKRWGLSVGVGAVVGSDGRVRPGVFAGVTYTFLMF